MNCVGVRHHGPLSVARPQARPFSLGHFRTGAPGQTSSPQANRCSICSSRFNHRSLRARLPPPLPAISEVSRVLDTADVLDYCFSRPWRRAFGTRQRCDERESPCYPNTFRAPGLGQRMIDSLTSFPSVDGLVVGRRDERLARPWLLRPAIPITRSTTAYRWLPAAYELARDRKRLHSQWNDERGTESG
jgi:hypothetical protein